MQAAVQEVITSAVNESRLLGHLRTMFTSSAAVFGEAMQNARRAGATHVSFDYDKSGDELVIQDDGIGIADFKDLITVAESGWDDALQQDERPFGMGFFSIAFAAERVKVESKGKQIEFAVDDLIAKRHITVEKGSFLGGTRVTLIGFKLGNMRVEDALRAYASGFPLPVRFNGLDLPRPDAQAALPGVMTEVGFVSIPIVHRPLRSLSSRYWRLYCQGLPVGLKNRSLAGSHEEAVIVHVDHGRFTPRMPDRDVFMDSDEVHACITKAISKLWLAFLCQRKAEMSPLEFAETFWRDAEREGLLSVMNDVPVLPGIAFEEFSEVPFDCAWGERYTWTGSKPLTQADVVSGVTVLMDENYSSDEEEDSFAKLVFARAAGWCLVSGLPDGHWAVPYIKDPRKLDVTIEGKVLATDAFSGRFVWATVELYEELRLTMEGKTLTVKDPVTLGVPDENDFRMLIPKDGMGSADRALRQASTYVDGDTEQYQSTDFELDCSELEQLLAIMAGEAPEVTLKKCLVDSRLRSKQNVFGRTFTVVIDDEGEVQVIAA